MKDKNMQAIGFKGKNIAALGLGRSGRSAALALQDSGAHVIAWDDTPAARDAAQKDGVNLQDLTIIDWSTIHELVLSPGIPHHYPAPHPIVALAKAAGLKPTSDIEILYKTQPEATYVGITGTNGKSTTTSLIAHIIKAAGHKCEVGGNIGIPVMNLEPLGKDGTYVLEMSSYQLEITPSIHFDVSVLLNITPDHLDRHGGLEGYISAKKLIYANSTHDDTLIIGIDDPHCFAIYEHLKTSSHVNLVPISVQKRISDGLYVKDGQLIDGGTGSMICDLSPLLRLKGQHNWQNTAVSFATCRALGLKDSEIIKALESFPGLAHRQQLVKSWQQIRFVNDSKATNAEAVAQALAAYSGENIYWLAGGRPKEGGITALEPYFATVNHAFIYGEAQDLFALSLEGKVPYTRAKDLREATELALKKAANHPKKETVVMLSPACSSFDQFKDFERRGEAFCDYINELTT